MVGATSVTSIRSGVAYEAQAGPQPSAITAAADVYIAEGTDTLHGRSPRQNLIERLDSATLQVLASAAAVGVTAMAVADGRLWAATDQGHLLGFDPVSLTAETDIDLEASGTAEMAADTTHLWVLDSTVTADAALLHTIALPTMVRTVSTLARSGTIGRLALGPGGPWAAVNVPGGPDGLLYSATPEGLITQTYDIGAPAGLAVSSNRMYWVSFDGDLGSVDLVTGNAVSPVGVGHDAYCLTAAVGLLWVCSDVVVLVRP